MKGYSLKKKKNWGLLLTVLEPIFTTFVTCFVFLNKLSIGKTFICKVERLNVRQHRS